MDSHKATSSALTKLPDLFQSLDLNSIKTHLAAVDQTLAAQHARLTDITSHFESLAKKHNELITCFTDRVTILNKAHTTMQSEIQTLKSETSEIKGMVSTILQLLQSSQAPSVSSAPAATTTVQASVEGEKKTINPLKSNCSTLQAVGPKNTY